MNDYMLPNVILLILCTAVVACADNTPSSQEESSDEIATIADEYSSEINVGDDEGVQEKSAPDLDKVSVYALMGDVGTAYIFFISDRAAFFNKGPYFHAAHLTDEISAGDELALYAMPSQSQEPYLGSKIKVVDIDDKKVVIQEIMPSGESPTREYLRVSNKDSRLDSFFAIFDESIGRLPDDNE